MPSEHFIEITLNDWKDIHKLTPAIAEQFVFRGQSFETWDLKTKQRRYFDLNDAIEQEAILLSDFDRIYPKILSNTRCAAFLEYALQKHYAGENLRFLDFTNSFLIALYFALKEGNNNSSVYALNITHLYSDALDLLNNRERKNQFSELELSHVNTDYFHQVLVNSISSKGLIALQPLETNSKALKQQTIHVIPKRIDIAFIRNLPYSHKKVLDSNKIDNYLYQYPLIKFIIPAKLRSEICDYLQMVNITESIIEH